MKIILTQAEACKMATTLFGYDVTEVILVAHSIPEIPLHQTIRNIIEPMLGEKGKLNIPAIKELRSIAKLGLAEAKWAIDNWEKWIGFVQDYKRLPIDYYQGNLR